MNPIMIVGSGPVGSFMSVLCAHAGFSVTVYEKRDEFTREINLKMENNFFHEVQEVLTRLKVKSNFFDELNDFLSGQNNKIQIKELEKKLSAEARSMGVRFIVREVSSFDEVEFENELARPIILDCTGRNSRLRVDEFGSDENNLVVKPLQYAMYINFRAIMRGNLSLYQVMKYVNNVKLSEVVVSKKVDEKGYQNATIPAFITNELAQAFDAEFPDINKLPLEPFKTPRTMSDSIFFPISSLIGNLIVDGCCIDLDSVQVKKITITCGYAQRRSKNNFVCLGDSAIHLAFFKSLRLGLRHALDLFVQLSMLRNEYFSHQDVLQLFKQTNPLLNPIKVFQTQANGVFLVATQVIAYGCYSFCVANRRTTKLTGLLGASESKFYNLLIDFNQRCNWKDYLKDFEAKRTDDIGFELRSNLNRNVFYDLSSWFIYVNGKSFLKFSESSRSASGKQPLFQDDFKFLMKCLKARRKATSATQDNKINHILTFLKQDKSVELTEMKIICGLEYLTVEDKLEKIKFIVKNKQLLTRNKLCLFILHLIENEIDSSEITNSSGLTLTAPQEEELLIQF